MVIATQNPIEQAGTYQLPEAQLDRFLMKTSVGHPDAESTERLLMDANVRDRAAGLQPVATGEDVIRLSALADRVYVDRSLVRYVREVAEASRQAPEVRLGISARGCLSWIRAARSWALSDGRGHVVPEDIQTVAHQVIGHRLLLQPEALFSGRQVTGVVDSLLDGVAAPRQRD
jgi:MoxR-like ATPase